jgi:hypothetical protein
MLTLHSGSARALESITCARKLSDSFSAGTIEPEEVLLTTDPDDDFVRRRLQTRTVTKIDRNTGALDAEYVFYFDEFFADPVSGTQWFTLDQGLPTVPLSPGNPTQLTMADIEMRAAEDQPEWFIVPDAVSAEGLVYVDDTGVVQGVAFNDNGGSPISESCMVSFPITMV